MNKRQLRLPDFWPLFFILSFFEAAVALLALLRVPSEGASFSSTRWVLLFPLLVALPLSALAAYFSWRNLNFRITWLDTNTRPKLYKFLSVAFPILAAAGCIGAFTLRWWNPERLLPFFERAWPLLAFVILFSVQSTLWLLFVRYGIHKTEFKPHKPTLITFIVLLFVFGFISLTRLGISPDPAYWGEPGVPLQAWQLGLALMLSASFFSISLSQFFNKKSQHKDFLIGTLIWILAAGIWLSVPNDVLKNSFYFPIDPPANMPLPYSDSGYYDSMAHSLLIGTDYTGEIPTRPLYILFLTGLHLLFGENYNLIIVGQTLVLASIPVIFYSLGKKLHSRTAGVTIALLAIFREWSNLLVSSDTRVSNSKIFLVDTPTLLLILLTCLFAFRWLERKDKLSALIVGGIFGILLLLRTQSIIILPVVLIVAFLALRAKNHIWLTPFFVFILGVVISVAPWLMRNYLHTGHITFDAPMQLKAIASQYAYTGNLDLGSVDLESESASQILVTFAIKDPGFVANFITNHFLATEVGAILALPLISQFNGLRAPINLYWTSFNGTLAWQNNLLIIAYLTVIAIGLGATWKRWRWASTLPLAFNLGYAAANGIGRFSGWRYDLPADWIAYFYFGIGFVEILIWSAKVFGFRVLETEDVKSITPSANSQNLTAKIITSAIVFALLGSLPWIAESVNPPARYPVNQPTTLKAQIIASQNIVSGEDVRAFASQTEAITLSGRLLYPRTFGGKSGLVSATPWPSYALRNYPRLGFKLLNQDLREIVFPNRGVPIENVQGKDVIVLGCERDGYVEARLLVFPNINLTYLSDWALKPCLE